MKRSGLLSTLLKENDSLVQGEVKQAIEETHLESKIEGGETDDTKYKNKDNERSEDSTSYESDDDVGILREEIEIYNKAYNKAKPRHTKILQFIQSNEALFKKELKRLEDERKSLFKRRDKGIKEWNDLQVEIREHKHKKE